MSNPRVWLVLWILFTLGMLTVYGQGSGYLLAVGRMTANDQEREGCMFAIGQGTMLVLHPEGDPCVRAREFIGKTGTLFFVPD